MIHQYQLNRGGAWSFSSSLNDPSDVLTDEDGADLQHKYVGFRLTHSAAVDGGTTCPTQFRGVLLPPHRQEE